MGRSFTPFTRLTLLVSELKSLPLTELTNTTKCDLLYHTGKLHEGIAADHAAAANEIGELGKTLFASVTAGDMTKAATDRDALLEASKKLRDLV